MLRVTSDQNKENPSRGGGCGCNMNRARLYQNVEFLPPTVSNRLDSRSNYALKDITSQKNNMCRCVSRARSKSSNEENIQRDKIVSSGISSKRRIAVPTAIEVTSHNTNNYVLKGVNKRPTEGQNINLYNHIVKREIRELLEDKRPISKRTDKLSNNQPKPTTLISSSHLTYDVFNDNHYTKHKMFNSTKLSTPHTQHHLFNSAQLQMPATNQVRRHSYSSVIDGEREHFATSQQYGTACDASNSHLSVYENATAGSTSIYQDGRTNTQNNHGQYHKDEYYPSGQRARSVDHRKPVVFPKLPNTVIHGKTPRTEVEYQIQQKCCSPVLPNRFTSQTMLISERPGKLREPKVKKRIYKNCFSDQSTGTYVGDIFNEEYLHDNLKYIRKQEQEITLNEHFFLRYNPNLQYRAAILNWLLKEQVHLNFSESEYYLAVNLLDHVLANVVVPINMYQLTIISTLWIAMKLIGSNFPKASTLISLCKSSYVTDQLLGMERKVLKIMDFKIHTSEPSICVNYYLKLFNLQENTLAKLSVYYILDSFSLTPQFSSTGVSTLAAACVKYILTKYHEVEEKKINYTFRKILSLEEADKVHNVEGLIFLQLMKMTDENYVYKEPCYKYNKNKRAMNVESTLNL